MPCPTGSTAEAMPRPAAARLTILMVLAEAIRMSLSSGPPAGGPVVNEETARPRSAAALLREARRTRPAPRLSTGCAAALAPPRACRRHSCRCCCRHPRPSGAPRRPSAADACRRGPSAPSTAACRSTQSLRAASDSELLASGHGEPADRRAVRVDDLDKYRGRSAPRPTAPACAARRRARGGGAAKRHGLSLRHIRSAHGATPVGAAPPAPEDGAVRTALLVEQVRPRARSVIRTAPCRPAARRRRCGPRPRRG